MANSDESRSVFFDFVLPEAWLKHDEKFIKLALKKLDDRLSYEEKVTLKDTLNSNGVEARNTCVILKNIPKDGRIQTNSKKWPPHVLYAHLFRNAELKSTKDYMLKGKCRFSFKEGNKAVCVHPWHYLVCF